MLNCFTSIFMNKTFSILSPLQAEATTSLLRAKHKCLLISTWNVNRMVLFIVFTTINSFNNIFNSFYGRFKIYLITCSSFRAETSSLPKATGCRLILYVLLLLFVLLLLLNVLGVILMIFFSLTISKFDLLPLGSFFFFYLFLFSLFFNQFCLVFSLLFAVLISFFSISSDELFQY